VGLGPRQRRHDGTRQTHLITGIAPAFSPAALNSFLVLLPHGTDHAAAFLRDFRLADAVKQSELELQRPDGQRRWIRIAPRQ
jgi:hypothetical protein